MIRYSDKAIKVVEQSESDGIVTVIEKIIIKANYLGDEITLVGWNGLSRERSFVSPKWLKKLRHIDNKKIGLSNPTTDTRPNPLFHCE